MALLSIDPFKQNPSLENHSMSLPPDATMDTLFHILLKKLKIDGVDSKPWTQKFNANLVMNLGLLMRLSEEAVKKLELPLLIQDELIKIIKQDALALVHLSTEKVLFLNQIISVANSIRSTPLLDVRFTFPKRKFLIARMQEKSEKLPPLYQYPQFQ